MALIWTSPLFLYLVYGLVHCRDGEKQKSVLGKWRESERADDYVDRANKRILCIPGAQLAIFWTFLFSSAKCHF